VQGDIDIPTDKILGLWINRVFQILIDILYM